VLYHELTHWVGAKHRLDRDLTGRFGSASYAAEELVAELGVPFFVPRRRFPASRQERTEWHRVVTFQSGLVDVLEKQAKKGRLVSVIGKLASRKYRREGEETDRTVTEIVVDLRGEIDFPTPPVVQAGAA
jgi:antirestriction protein ArdC